MRVGERIRTLREAHGLELSQFAAMVDLEPAQMAAIEAGTSLPPIGVILKVARGLDSRVGEILRAGPGRTEPFCLVRAGEERALAPGAAAEQATSAGYSYHSLLPADASSREMEPFLVKFVPVADKIDSPSTHEGEEFVYLMEGEIEVLYAGETHLLRPGDSVYLDARRPHLLRGRGSKPSVALAVVYWDRSQGR